jgi:hypothetical protein
LVRRAAKVDVNHGLIVDALRSLGYSVFSTAALPKFFDIVFGKYGISYCAEIKRDNRQKLTEHQEKLWSAWLGHMIRFDSVDDVIEFDRKRSKRHTSRSRE